MRGHTHTHARTHAQTHTHTHTFKGQFTTICNFFETGVFYKAANKQLRYKDIRGNTKVQQKRRPFRVCVFPGTRHPSIRGFIAQSPTKTNSHLKQTFDLSYLFLDLLPTRSSVCLIVGLETAHQRLCLVF